MKQVEYQIKAEIANIDMNLSTSAILLEIALSEKTKLEDEERSLKEGRILDMSKRVELVKALESIQNGAETTSPTILAIVENSIEKLEGLIQLDKERKQAALQRIIKENSKIEHLETMTESFTLKLQQLTKFVEDFKK